QTMPSGVVSRPRRTCTRVPPLTPPMTVPLGPSRRRPTIPSSRLTVAAATTSGGSGMVAVGVGSGVSVGGGVLVGGAAVADGCGGRVAVGGTRMAVGGTLVATTVTAVAVGAGVLVAAAVAPPNRPL